MRFSSLSISLFLFFRSLIFIFSVIITCSLFFLFPFSLSFFLSTELSFSDTREYQKYYSKKAQLAL